MLNSKTVDRLSRMVFPLKSKHARALTKFVPMEPAPPVTRTVLRRKVSDTSPMSGHPGVQVFHPLHGASNALLRIDLWVVLQIFDRLGAIHRFCLGREGLRVFVGDEGIVAADDLED